MIKIRAYDKGIKKMVTDFTNGYEVSVVGGVLKVLSHDDSGHPIELPVMLFTGVTNNDGKDLFDGDILKTVMDGVPKIGIIKWENEINPLRWYVEWGDKTTTGLYTNFEPIGNIFDNPELLPK